MSDRRECGECGRMLFRFVDGNIEAWCRHCKKATVYAVDFDKRTITVQENELFKTEGMSV